MDIYRSFINDLTELLPAINESNNESIISVYLGGSVSRGDYIVGISDIDLYMVMKNQNESNEINNAIQNLAKKELPELLSWCPDGVTVAFTSYQDIKSGASWLGNGSEYLNFQEAGKLLYGKDIKHEIIAPNDNEIIVSSNQAIRQIKQIVQQEVSSVPGNKYFVRGVFSAAFSAIHFYLCTNRQYLRGKEQTVHVYSELNPAGAGIAKELLSLWRVFSQRELSNAEIARLIDYTKELVNSL